MEDILTLSAYTAGLEHPFWPTVGKVTPGSKEGLKPFMFTSLEEVVTPNSPGLLDAHIAVDGLYRYMDHPMKTVVYGFGPKTRNVVNEFLNHRIGERSS